MARSILLVGAALISVSVSPLNAEASEARWCAVISRNDGDVHWDCTYRSIEECRPNVIASNGNRSFCTPSPYYVANPPELRNSRPASQMSSKTTTAIKTSSCKATKRNRACRRKKSKLTDHHGTRGPTVYTTLGNTRSCPEKRTDHNRWENGGSSIWSACRNVRSCSEKRTDHSRWENGGCI